jgi:NAD(P)-dependent dehydrogenase (short-subunit alcohol dehydrogenase family)
MSEFDLADQVIIVTGAGGGIGREISLEFAAAGAIVVLVGRTEKSLKSVADELGDAQSLIVPTDITKPAEVEKLVATTVDALGRIDILVNNAGGGVMPCKAEDTSYDDWVKMIDINLTATFNCCIAIGKQMIKQKSGKIINISSTAGTKGHPGMLHYSAAKAGVISLSNNLAYNWAEHNICVNALHRD